MSLSLIPGQIHLLCGKPYPAGYEVVDKFNLKTGQIIKAVTRETHCFCWATAA